MKRGNRTSWNAGLTYKMAKTVEKEIAVRNQCRKKLAKTHKMMFEGSVLSCSCGWKLEKILIWTEESIERLKRYHLDVLIEKAKEERKKIYGRKKK